MSMNQSEQIAALTALVVEIHRRNGLAQQLRGGAFGSADSMGQLAKLCGTTPDIVRAWERGAVQPTTTQALTWLSALYSRDAYGLRTPRTYEATQDTDAGDAEAGA